MPIKTIPINGQANMVSGVGGGGVSLQGNAFPIKHLTFTTSFESGLNLFLLIRIVC